MINKMANIKNLKRRNKIITLWQKGKSKNAIAKKLDLKRSLVYYYIKKYGEAKNN